MSTRNHIPDTVSASPEARLAAYSRGPRLGLVDDLKLMFASLGAGNSVVPLGDNHRAARLLAEYANSLRQN